MEIVGGNGSETGQVTKKKGGKSITGIGASLTPDYREQESSNIPLTPFSSDRRSSCLHNNVMQLG